MYVFNGIFFTTWEIDNNKYGSPGNIFINNEQSGIINRQEYIVLDLLAKKKYELSWVPIMADIDMKKRKSTPLELNVHSGVTYFLTANTRDAGSNVGCGLVQLDILESDLLFIDEEAKELSKTSTRLVHYKVFGSDFKV